MLVCGIIRNMKIFNMVAVLTIVLASAFYASAPIKAKLLYTLGTG